MCEGIIDVRELIMKIRYNKRVFFPFHQTGFFTAVAKMRLCWKLLQRPGAQALPSMTLPEAKAIPKPLAVNSIPSYDAVVKTRKDKINPGLLTYYKKPLYITQGSMQWLWDDKGKN